MAGSSSWVMVMAMAVLNVIMIDVFTAMAPEEEEEETESKLTPELPMDYQIYTAIKNSAHEGITQAVFVVAPHHTTPHQHHTTVHHTLCITALTIIAGAAQADWHST